MDANELSNALRQIAESFWDENARPLFLSALPRALLQRLGVDYKDALVNESLKAFILRTGQQSGYRLVEHPKQRAKLGIVPSNVTFEFELEEASPRTLNITRKDVEAFARVLMALSAEERKLIAIPADAVARLLLVE